MTSKMFHSSNKFWPVLFTHGAIELSGIVPANELPNVIGQDFKNVHMQDEDGNEYTFCPIIVHDRSIDGNTIEYTIMDVVRQDGSALNNTVLAGGALYKLELLDSQPI